MRDFERDIAEMVAAAGLGTIGVDLFVGGIPPDVTGRLCTVVISDSVDVLPYVSTDRDQVTAQISVTVRGLGGRAAGDDPLGTSRARAMAALTACHRASTNIYSRIVALDLPALEWVSNDLPEWTFTVEVTCDSVHAVTELVILPRDGVLRLDGVEFPDGSTLTSAPPPVDLSAYATLDGAEMLSNKTLASPTVTGPLLPATAGQQALGSAAVPWGPMYLRADGNTAGEGGPLEVDGGNITNQRVANFRNLGPGITGPRFFRAAGGWMDIAHSLGNSWLISVTNRTLRFRASGRVFDSTAPQGFAFSDDQATRAVVAITGTQPVHGRTADLLQFRPFDDSLPEASVARVGVDGEIETVAGVVLHSPNGTRYRITVADDGTLSTEAA